MGGGPLSPKLALDNKGVYHFMLIEIRNSSSSRLLYCNKYSITLRKVLYTVRLSKRHHVLPRDPPTTRPKLLPKPDFLTAHTPPTPELRDLAVSETRAPPNNESSSTLFM